VTARTPGQGLYARVERERRWLLPGLPDGVHDPAEIVDTYVAHSTLRLRRLRSAAGTAYKLGQKVRHDPARPSLVQLTNIYLTEAEYERLVSALGGDVLTKTRWHWAPGGRVLSVDQFGGRLEGLVLAEVELGPDDDGPPGPPVAVAEVTEDDRFAGGRLAQLDAGAARDLLALAAAMAGSASARHP
jgi:CYTH domain-containing protein